MLLNKIDRYYETNSLIHKMNPIIKMLNFIIFVIIIISNDLLTNLILIDLLVLLMIISKVPLSIYLEPLIRLKYFFLVLFLTTLLIFPFSDCLVILVKIIVIIWYLELLTLTTSQSEIIYSLEILFNPLNYLKIPVNKLALEISFIIRFIPMMFNQNELITNSLVSRGIKRKKIKYNLITRFLIYINSFKICLNKINKIKVSMKMRLFSINVKRTNYRINKVSFFDIMLLGIHICILIFLK